MNAKNGIRLFNGHKVNAIEHFVFSARANKCHVLADFRSGHTHPDFLLFKKNQGNMINVN